MAIQRFEKEVSVSCIDCKITIIGEGKSWTASGEFLEKTISERGRTINEAVNNWKICAKILAD